MVELIYPFDAWVIDVLVQSSLLLVIGLFVAKRLRSPARAHAVLLAALLGAVVAPIASGLARHWNLGLLSPALSGLEPAALAVMARPLPEKLGDGDKPSEVEWPRENGTRRGAASRPLHNQSANPESHIQQSATATVNENVSSASSAPWQGISRSSSAAGLLAAAWFGSSLLMFGRLLFGARTSVRLLRSAQRFHVPEVETALERVREKLELPTLPIQTLSSPSVRCPVIWCWGRQARIVLPHDSIQRNSIADWTPLFCHELAHWKRRDHWSALLAEIVCCLLPWQPLAWWTKRRMEEAGEQACDDWAVHAGNEATNYAEMLLNLATQPNGTLSLAALRRRSGLARRIRRILVQRLPSPRLGVAWSASLLVVALTIVTGAALCQRGLAQAEAADLGAVASGDEASRQVEPASPRPSANLSASATAEDSTVQGRVVDSDGNPVPGARITWLRRAKTDNKPKETTETFAVTTSDAEGRFALKDDMVPTSLAYSRLLVRAAGFGLRGFALDLENLEAPVEIRLDPSYAIAGSVLAPDGKPVQGATVLLSTISRTPEVESPEMDANQRWYAGVAGLSVEDLPTYWPAPVTTNEKGEFRFDDLVPLPATAELLVLAENYANTLVGVAHPNSALGRGKRGMKWREPRFTLVLEEPYVLNGRFVDEESGAGVAGVEIAVMPSREGGTFVPTNRVAATSNQEGRFEMRVGSAEYYRVKVLPPPGYPGIDDVLYASTIERFAGNGRQLKYELKLKRQTLLRGRVVAADTGEPVPDVDVVYQPALGRGLGTNNRFEAVKTKADGSFELTGATGKGFLLADAPGKEFYRLVVDASTADGFGEKKHPHGFLAVNVDEEDPSPSFTVELHRGRNLVVRGLDPAGKPVRRLTTAFIEQEMGRYFSSNPGESGTVQFSVDPNRSYRLFLFSEDAVAGKVVELTAPEDGKTIDVQLEPCATIRGRYVHSGGAPFPEVSNFPKFQIDPGRDLLDGDDILNLPFYYNFSRFEKGIRGPGRSVTDKEGNFELPGIVPGALIYLQLNYLFDDGKNYHEIGALAPGEVKDVGNLVIRSR